MSGIRIGGAIPQAINIAGAPAQFVYEAGVLVWQRDPAVTIFSTSGLQSYTVPAWARYIDFVALGSGGGGFGAAGAFHGGGGYGGNWDYKTVEVGSIFNQGTVLEVQINPGGSGGSGGAAGGNGAQGGDARVSTTGSGGENIVFGAGGARGSQLASGSIVQDGGPPQTGNVTANATPYTGFRDVLFNGVTYLGAARSTTATTNAPGGGGRGGTLSFGNAASGSLGRIWITARSF